MDAWRETNLHALIATGDVNELFEWAAKAARGLGFDYCAYGIRMPFPVTRPGVVMINNYSAAWQEQYQKHQYLTVDPTVRHGVRSIAPILWTQEVFSSTPDLWENANAHGLKYGWAQSSRDMKGAAGMLTLARSGEAITARELAANEAKMLWLTQMTHAGMAKILMPRFVPEADASITARELEILRWTADGKTSSEIGQILSISVATVNFHVNNVVTKLGATNKMQAAVKAALLGLLN